MQSGTVLRVIDGDTFDLIPRERIRLEGLDAPELPSPQGVRAKSALERLIGGRVIQYLVKARDCYGRLIAQVWVNGTNVNDAMRRFLGLPE